jgi:hypothetical protein
MPIIEFSTARRHTNHKKITLLLLTLVAFLPCNADDFSTTHAKAEQGDAAAPFKLGKMYEYGPIAPHRPIEIEKQEHAVSVLLCFRYKV